MSDLRMPDLNRVILVGRLTRDPELRYLPSGTAVCKLGLAVSRNYKTREGERKEETTFVNVDVWDRQAEYCRDYLQKGRPVLVEGSLRSSEWEDRTSGQRRTSIEVRAQRIQQLDWEDRGSGGGGGGQSRQSSDQQPARQSRDEYEEPVPEDDIPF